MILTIIHVFGGIIPHPHSNKKSKSKNKVPSFGMEVHGVTGLKMLYQGKRLLHQE